MDKFRYIIVCIMSSFIITGCSIEMESPEKLITEKAVYDEENYFLYENVEKFVRSSDMILPMNSDDVGQINQVDLNNDNKEEIIVFKKSVSLEDEVEKISTGFVVLENTIGNSYIEKYDVSVEAQSIEYANFYDLNNDGILEIIISYNKDDSSMLEIYEIKGDELVSQSININWILGSSSSKKIKIEIDDINNDYILDIIIVSKSDEYENGYISIANYDKSFNIIDTEEIKNLSTISSTHIKVGNINMSTKGIVFDYLDSIKNKYVTKLMYFNKDKLETALIDEKIEITKPYYIESEDINNDEILDIPVISDGMDGVKNTIKSYELINWYNYNKIEDKSENLVFISQIYYNYNYNFKLLIPNTLQDKLYITQIYEGENVYFEFYYINKDLSKDRLFTINALSKNNSQTPNKTEESKIVEGQSIFTLGESNNYMFTLTKNNEEKLKELNITSEALKGYFSIVY